MSPIPPIPPTEPARTPDDPFVRSLAAGVRATVDVAPPLSLDEIRDRPAQPQQPAPRSPVAWRLAAAAAVVVVLISAGLTLRHRDEEGPAASGPPPGALLAIPTDPTGPVPAANTAASTGQPVRTSSARWDVVRTGADDRQLVVAFDGGGCGTFRADVAETADAVSIAIYLVFPDDGSTCPAVGAPGAIGIELSEPLGTRRLDGSRPVEGNDVPGPLVVSGADLATLTWPPDAERATAEGLIRGLGPDSYVWTQRFDGPPDDDGLRPSVSLEQWHGATPIDEGAFFQTCRFGGQPESTEPVDVNGTAATFVRCANGGEESPPRSSARAVLWMEGTDRLMVRADPAAPGATDLDDAALVDLARSVRRGD